MKTLNVIIERNADGFFAYTDEIDGCVAGGNTYIEVKTNFEEILDMFLQEDTFLANEFANGYKLKFNVSLESVFELIPEVNISQLAKSGGLNASLLRQYVSGSKKASEKQAQKIMSALNKLSEKIETISLNTI
ncbi:type II toxin-antitoxin system HicB family antitoxin [Cryomorpha ignava]|uniref:Type II toxin-antitoxin system HicB family antitoxin n=1 Tax=Cryomorpha ignava TaxID=101383 RepID=A0A7K3WMN1_9FLAO|nr:type II toxin-antitoxin system HicB family antitoxin [Cryomorpha ignava]NEN22907.1 type II toxin-antitoxin system HicB family antitoxin [Cryomorpha ignava]